MIKSKHGLHRVSNMRGILLVYFFSIKFKSSAHSLSFSLVEEAAAGRKFMDFLFQFVYLFVSDEI